MTYEKETIHFINSVFVRVLLLARGTAILVGRLFEEYYWPSYRSDEGRKGGRCLEGRQGSVAVFDSFCVRFRGSVVGKYNERTSGKV